MLPGRALLERASKVRGITIRFWLIVQHSLNSLPQGLEHERLWQQLPTVIQNQHSSRPAGYQQDSHFQPFQGKLRGEFDSSHPGHPEIGQQKVNFSLVISGLLQCFKAVHGNNDVIAALLQKGKKGAAVMLFILCQQDCLLAIRRRGAPSFPPERCWTE
jgi:hypothetical protein